MAQKITLSIPDMLHEKLSEWRNSFNFSKLFQEALTDAIQKKEALRKRFSEEFDMPEIVKRLRQEKEAWEDKFFRSGRKEGIRWGKAAHFEQLMHVLHIEDTYPAENTYHITDHEDYKHYFEQIYEAHELGKYAGISGAEHEQKFIDGWFEGVRSFWNEIKEQI